MNGKKMYIAILVSMTLLAALGIWTIVDRAIAYQNRPRLEDYNRPSRQTTAYANPLHAMHA